MEILNVISHVSGLIVLAAFVFSTGLAIIIVECSDYIRAKYMIIGGAILAIGIALGVMSFTILSKTQYEVILKDDSSYEYIMTNYKVIDQRGKIWVIEEKNRENKNE